MFNPDTYGTDMFLRAKPSDAYTSLGSNDYMTYPSPSEGILGSDNFMTYAPPKDPPRVRLQRKIAQSNLQSQEEKRAADNAAMPFILRDMQSKQRAEIEKAEALQAQLDQAQRALQAPAPTREVAQMSQGQMIAAILGSILNPRGTNQTIDQMQGFAQQREDLDFENQMRQFGLGREDAQALMQQLTRQLSGAQDAARDYEKMGYDYQQNAERLAQDQLQWEAEMDLKNRGLTQKQTSAEARIEMDIFKTMWRNAGPEGRAALLAQNGKNPAFIQAFSELTPQEQNIEARTADTKDKTLDRQMTRPLRMKKVQADIDATIARGKLSDENRRLIGLKADYYDDEFALKKWDREIRAENARIYRQNVESLAATRGLADPSALRQALNQERLVISELLSLNQAQLKSKPDDPALIAEQADLKAQLYDLNQKMNPERGLSSSGGGLDIGADGFGLVKPFNPVQPGVELRGSIGQPPKSAPGKPTNQRRTPPRSVTSGKGKATVKIIRED